MSQPKLIAITGGIGAGKSIVSKILRTMGFKVFDCDIEAKRLMDESEDIKAQLIETISSAAVGENGTIDRKHIASIVFSDKEKLELLNSIVHTAVRDEFASWISTNSADRLLFVETAILYQSRLDKMVDEVWDVVAPEEIRISRVMKRNQCSSEDVRSRIESQNVDPEKPHANTHRIINDDFTPVVPQILALL